MQAWFPVVGLPAAGVRMNKLRYDRSIVLGAATAGVIQIVQKPHRTQLACQRPSEMLAGDRMALVPAALQRAWLVAEWHDPTSLQILNVGSSGDVYRSIRDALAAAENGDTIVVAAGT